jgi:hypothetical protein
MADHTSAFARFSIGRRATLFRDRLAPPYYFIEPAVLAIDFVLVVCAGVIAGIGYHWIFLNRLPDPGPYVEIGALAALNLMTTLTALMAYELETLISLKHQARKVMLVWVIVFLALLSVAFTLKIGEALSRGATLGFLVVGRVFLFIWRSTSCVLPELQRCGYQPVSVFAISKPDYKTTGMPETLLETLDCAIKRAPRLPHKISFSRFLGRTAAASKASSMC